VHITNRSDDGKVFSLQYKGGYVAMLEKTKCENGSPDYKLLSPDDPRFLDFLTETFGFTELNKLYEPIKINGESIEYSVKFTQRPCTVRKAKAVCSGSGVLTIEKKGDFVKPEIIMHGSETEIKLKRDPFEITYSGIFDLGMFTKGKITVQDSSQNETLCTINGEFVAKKDGDPKLNGMGTVDVGPYQITGNFKEGVLLIDGHQTVSKTNKGGRVNLGPIMPERTDMKNKRTFRDGGESVVLTFNRGMGLYTCKILKS